MKTVATKIDNTEFEKFENKCNDKGCSKSETLRELIRHFTEHDHAFRDNTRKELPTGTLREVKSEPQKIIFETLPDA
ncbi:MAG: hypothetical protein YK1309IOTA_450001 [Marine Group I thaumarchaeote]|nr:MAG: hypothetical protein YK1309IOTA_450001 [Marine Group I thaumarchaeote]